MADLQNIIRKFLGIYPRSLRNLFKGSVISTHEKRYRKSQRIEGSYDLETGEIILWNPQNSDEEDLFIILTHEWGHKFYHEGLSDKARSEWLKIRSEEKIDFDLDKSYPLTKLPEEEYCTVFCLVSKKLYLRKMGMKTHEIKIAKRLKKEFPKAVALIENQMKTATREKETPKSSKQRNITHQEVQTIKTWIHKTIQI